MFPFQSSAFKIAIELINADSVKAGSKVQFSVNYKSKLLEALARFEDGTSLCRCYYFYPVLPWL